jgi:hypothetical protein
MLLNLARRVIDPYILFEIPTLLTVGQLKINYRTLCQRAREK